MLALLTAIGFFPIFDFCQNTQPISPTSNSLTQRPLPDIASLIREVHAHQEELEAVPRNYIYRETIEIDQLESDGCVKHSSVEEREVFYIGGHPISHVIRKDGYDLSPAEKK